MKTGLFLLIFIQFLSLFPARASIQNGDLILQSNACYLCGLIEAEEKSPYSHMGILVKDHGRWNVLEAWNSVRKTPLDEFLNRRRKNTAALILRTKSYTRNTQLNSKKILERFSSFDGLHYDSAFLWNNGDELGEKLYCSEFVAKFLQTFLDEEIHTKPMHFEIHRELWIKFFHGNPPDGAQGLSPGDFERSPLFEHVGFL